RVRDAGRDVAVRLSPGIEWHHLTQIWPAPIFWRITGDGKRAQRVEPLIGRRVAVVVDAIGIERQREDLDLASSRVLARLSHVAEQRRRDDGRERGDDGDCHQQLDEREAYATSMIILE